MKTMYQALYFGLLVPAMLMVPACHSKDPANDPVNATGTTTRYTTSADGTVMTVPRDQAGRFATETARLKKFVIKLKAPARTVAAAIPSADLQQPLVLFETQDVAQLYSDYTKNRAAFERSRKQLERMRELLEKNATSGKEVLDAETDYLQSEASSRESESKLRQYGYNPNQLSSMKTGLVFIIADVPEAKIQFVDMGEKAWLEFNSFPGETFVGHVSSISDVVDPQTRTIKVGIELSNSNGRLKSGMFARVSIEEREMESVAVSQEAVVSAEAKTFVFVKTNETTFERREVLISADEGKEFQVLSGVRPGERVVISHAILLKGMSFGY